jgi:uncharacterized membrane protein
MFFKRLFLLIGIFLVSSGCFRVVILYVEQIFLVCSLFENHFSVFASRSLSLSLSIPYNNLCFFL